MPGGGALPRIASVEPPKADIPALRAHLYGRFDIWQADAGSLRPVVTETDPVSSSCENLWLRRSGADPWEYDVILMDTSDTTWSFKRDARVSRPLTEILWERAGIRYLRPEVQLLHKAAGNRPKDQADFDSCRPLLDAASRDWLHWALQVAHPGHPWLEAW